MPQTGPGMDVPGRSADAQECYNVTSALVQEGNHSLPFPVHRGAAAVLGFSPKQMASAVARFARCASPKGPNECWPWRGYIEPAGYGVIGFTSQNIRVHRLAFVLLHGHLPDPMGCHRCHNRACCNPWHIREGTARSNWLDAHERGTHASKLPSDTARTVKWIGTFDPPPLSSYAVGKLFDVDGSAIRQIWAGKTWAFVSAKPAGEAIGIVMEALS